MPKSSGKTQNRKLSSSEDSSDVMELLRELKKSVDFCCDKIHDFEAKLNKISDQIKLIEPLQAECNLLKAKVENLEQRSRINNVEIIGVPEKANENLVDIVSNIGKKVNCPVAEHEIDAVHRVTPFNFDKNKPKHIILRFVSRLKKEKFLLNAKTLGNLTTSSIGFSNNNNKIYVNDHLSPNNKLLLKSTKDKAREKNYKYTWVKNCKIFVRKNETSPIILISRETDLYKL